MRLIWNLRGTCRFAADPILPGISPLPQARWKSSSTGTRQRAAAAWMASGSTRGTSTRQSGKRMTQRSVRCGSRCRRTRRQTLTNASSREPLEKQQGRALSRARNGRTNRPAAEGGGCGVRNEERNQTPCSSQSRSRRQHVAADGNSLGKSCQQAPETDNINDFSVAGVSAREGSALQVPIGEDNRVRRRVQNHRRSTLLRTPADQEAASAP